MKDEAENYVAAGQALIGLGRHLQRTFPKPNVIGCQYGEESILERLLPEPTGIYVEIGASHPTDCSNSHFLYKRGWRGLLIEPLPYSWPALLLERPEDYLCPLACSNVDGYASLNICRTVSSLVPNWRDDNEGQMPVQTATLASILKMYPAVNWSDTKFCSIDTEGHEAEVVAGFDWTTFHPRVLMLEAFDQRGNDISGAWRPILDAQGYVLHHGGALNQIFVRK